MIRGWKYWLFVRIPIWFLASSVLLVMLLRWVPVRYTPLMLKRAFQFKSDDSYHREQKWVSLEDMSPELIKAVTYCEDQRYWQHQGFDWTEMRAMWRGHRSEDVLLRGCSTIS
jgi:monofunctional biosynthetic peptidoglycan transglycosylase